MAQKIVVIGGSAAGAKAAAKARRIDQNAEITIIQKDHDLSMASCGYPYYVGGTFNNRNALLATPTGVIRDPLFFQKTKAVKALNKTEALAINPKAKTVTCKNLVNNEEFSLPYDKLIYCTGARARRIPIPGIDLDGISTLLSMEDTDFLHSAVTEKKITHAVVIGGGLIGVEACEALVERGVKVTLVEMAPQILVMLDPQFAQLVANHMKARGVDVRTGVRMEAFEGENGKLTAVQLEGGERVPCELAVMSTGVQPNVEVAAKAGLKIGSLGALEVNEFMQTSEPSIYAAGDCVECTNIITGKKVLAPMGDLANLQGRIAGENAALDKNDVTFPGTTQTAICRVFAFKAGVTGLTEKQAENAGITGYETVVNASPDKPGFMGAGILISKLLVNQENEQILGFQCIGNGDVSREVAAMSLAVQAKMTVTQMVNADMPYAPPFSTAIDHCIASAHIMQNKLKGRLKTITAEEVHKKLHNKEKPFLLDGRSPDEYEEMRLGIGEKLIPMGAVREKLEELPKEKSAEIICFCKVSLRGYETALILENAGYTNVRVMEGGIMAWPYKREK